MSVGGYCPRGLLSGGECPEGGGGGGGECPGGYCPNTTANIKSNDLQKQILIKSYQAKQIFNYPQ